MSSNKLLEPHYTETVKRIKSSDSNYILAIQDQMVLNYTSHKAKTDLGSIGKSGKTEQYGIIQHSMLCVTEKNDPLGLMNIEFFDNEEFDTTKSRSIRPIEEKESYKWITSLKKMRSRLGDIDKKIITVADREGDFYEFVYELIKDKEDFVIRAQHDRKILQKETNKLSEDKLFNTIKKQKTICNMDVTIQDPKTREIKEITLKLKAKRITIPIPKKISPEQIKRHSYVPVEINVVIAYDDEHQWVLLTPLPLDKESKVREIVNIYKSRWHIEDFHKVLKTGYQVDEIYLHSSGQAILNFLSIAAISACRLYWLIYIGRAEESIKADEVFEEFEWKSVYVYFKEKIPDEIPPISVVILKIAQLGGYKIKKKAGPPGIKVMWTGFQHFTVAAQMYRNMSMKT